MAVVPRRTKIVATVGPATATPEVIPHLVGMIDGARLMKASRRQVITKVIIPSAMSWVFAGLKISVPYALIGAVLGEMIAANRGLGYLVQFSGSQFDTAGVFAVLIVIALLAVALNLLVDFVQFRMQKWRITDR